MDIAGAKALKERLGANAMGDDRSPMADVPEHAPPVYRYLGVAEIAPETPSAAPDEAPAKRGRSVLRRLRLLR